MDEILSSHNLLASTSLKRSDLLDQAAADGRIIRINVIRNHSFELIAATLDAFLALSDLRAEFSYSDYDDAFSLTALSEPADLHLLWVDLDRYDAQGQAYIIERLNTLGKTTTAPVIFAALGGEVLPEDSLCSEAIRDIATKIGDGFYDLRLASFTGTRCSPAACLEISRFLGLRLIPSLLTPHLKAVVVDLDNTLYQGVLGEDGIDGVVLQEGHIALQQKLADLAAQGIFICIASKNEEQDALDLFTQRQDFPLRPNMITKFMVNWDKKSKNISEIECFLNIHHSSMLFVDDNMGELFDVTQQLPDIKVLWASPDSTANARALENFPGLLKNSVSAEDLIRSKDVQANEERRRLQEQMAPEDYLRSLEVVLEFRINDPEQINRVAELSNKTNQFIFNYRRYSIQEVTRLSSGEKSCVVTISMRDKLVNSGIIGAVLAELKDGVVCIDDVFVSCRALGRGLNEIILLGALKCACDKLGSHTVQVGFQHGERNRPAAEFISSHLKEHVEVAAEFNYTFPQGIVEILVES
ncbi:MAG: HAD-IIIC family phosphatase [Acetobacter sp.]|uniref:HAD-IIIC family phosphatase n=1 Tax=Acetobacter sp. TaxID=440 RepID=UPI003D085105